jgi:prepilin-type N-terminal cleavage/methylation domain-containing protein
MNIKQMKSMISKFRSADVSVIKDADMRAKAQKLQKKQGGFTLLELLVVVAILAIIAGAVISSLDGQEELAAQKTTVHTMAAMEEAFQVYRVSERRRLPGNMDSLICSDAVDVSTDRDGNGIQVEQLYTTVAVPGAANTIIGGTSNVPRVGGGTTLDLGGELAVVEVDASFAAPLVNAGLTSLRYADADFCNDVEGDDTTGVDLALVDVVKPNLIFNNFVGEDNDEWEFGAGTAISYEGYLAQWDDGDGTDPGAITMALLEEPIEITGNVNDVIAVFGIGPSADIIGDYIARAPSDGNGGPDKYSNFSVAVRFATCDAGLAAADYETNCLDTDANWDDADVEVVAILDAGGDAYDDEVAEARGNQEE